MRKEEIKIKMMVALFLIICIGACVYAVKNPVPQGHYEASESTPGIHYAWVEE